MIDIPGVVDPNDIEYELMTEQVQDIENDPISVKIEGAIEYTFILVKMQVDKKILIRIDKTQIKKEGTTNYPIKITLSNDGYWNTTEYKVNIVINKDEPPLPPARKAIIIPITTKIISPMA